MAGLFGTDKQPLGLGLSRFRPASSTIAGGAKPVGLFRPPPKPNVVPKVIWNGASGTRYRFELYPVGTAFFEKPGVYIFCKQLPNGRFEALYVGESHDFEDRLTDRLRQHDAYPGVVRLGGTHICAAVISGGLTARLAVETDLRRLLNPPLNWQ